jgi:hypothetical protein
MHIVNYIEALSESFWIAGWEEIGLYIGFQILDVLIDPTFSDSFLFTELFFRVRMRAVIET